MTTNTITPHSSTSHSSTPQTIAPDTSIPGSNARPVLADIEQAIARRSFCSLSTVSPAGQPHGAGVIYTAVGPDLWVSTDRTSRKARNIAANPRVHVNIPVRRAPVGPPSSIHFAATAELFAPDDPQVTELVAQGALKAITSHGELELPTGCFVRITPDRVLHTYGLGLSLISLIRHPLHAAGRVVRT